MLIDGDGRFLTQRTHPQLARLAAEVVGPSLRLAHPACGELMVDLPADLPTPIFKSTLITGIKSTLRGDMDSGPAKQRPQFTKTPRLVSLSYLLFLAYRQGANFYG